jgi:predicted alpha/beta-hydrolase family hydrolase
VFQGTRDEFGSPEDLRAAAPALPVGSCLVDVEGGDHSLATSRGRGIGLDQRLAPFLDRAVAWMGEVH